MSLALGTLLVPGACRAQEIPDRKALEAESARATRLRQEGKLAEALPIARRVAEAAEKLFGGGATETADYLNQLALLYWDLRRYAQAESLYQRSLRIYETKRGTDDLEVATVLFSLAGLYLEMGQYAQAEPLFQRSLRIYEAQLGENHLAVAKCLKSLARLYHLMGRYTQAVPLLRRSLRLMEGQLGPDHPDVAGVLNNLAGLYKDMGRYTQAEPLFRRSLQIYEEKLGEDHPDVARGLLNLAGLYQALSQYGEAEALLQRSLRICEARLGKDHLRVAQCLNNLAALYNGMGWYTQAEPLLQRSLQIREAQLGKDDPNIAISLSNLGEVHRHLKQYAKAEPLFQRSLQIWESKRGKDHPDVTHILTYLSALYFDQGQSAKAEPLVQRSLRICEKQLGEDHPDVALYLHNLGTLYEATAQTARAAELIDRSRKLTRRHCTRVLPTLSEPEQLNFLRGIDETRRHIALSLGLRHPDDAKLAELSAAWLVNGKGGAQEALAQTALRVRDSRNPALRQLGDSLLQTRQELARLTLNPPDGLPAQQRQRRLDELNRREQDLAKRLRQAGGGGEDAAWVELATLRKALPPAGVLVALTRSGVYDFKAIQEQPAWQPEHYAAWIIPATGPVQVLDLGPADSIDAGVQKVRQALENAPKTIRLQGEADAEALVRTPLEALAKKVLHPLLPHIGKAKSWVLSPDGNLWLVPWAALPLPDGKYAVEDHAISYAINGRELLDTTPVDVKPAAPLVLADPDFDLGLDQVERATRRLRGQESPAETRGVSRALRLTNIKRLPATAAEAAAITSPLRQYAGVAPRVLTDREATAGVFLAAHNPKVVVLSTHGYFLPDEEPGPKEQERLNNAGARFVRFENPLLRCGLLLAGCNNAEKAKEGGDNGVLTGLQIVGTDLRGCELVVLSACETGLGEVRNGEGVAGLRQAFQLAGAQSVVATLWQVPDQQSAQLMTGFFDQLAARQGKAEALRNAQLALIRARRDKTAAAHPFFWAAFTVTGR
jgi:CHAT domain-containing protein/Tfp pilus assembly protein PilF